MVEVSEGQPTAGVLPRRVVAMVFVTLLVIHVGLLAASGWRQSPTLNEPGHLVAGLHHWDTGDFTLYRVNPPLVRMVASAPSALIGYQEDWSGYYERVGARPVFDMGEDFIAANGRRTMLHLRLARFACIPFSLLGACVCFAWSRDLFGNVAGLLATTLWCFSPMILGYASMIAPDAHATSLGLAACYTFWRWLKKPTWRQAILTGFVLGLAELSKTTMILFYPLWPLLWLAYRWPDRHEMNSKRWRDEIAMLVLRMAIGVYVLNLGYLGEGSFTPLKEFKFVSDLFSGDANAEVVGNNRFSDSWLGELPMPFPSNYLIGIDVQQRDFEDFSRPSYLNGKFQSKGWWYYYAYAILVKVPLGTLGLGLLAIAIAFTGLRPDLDLRDAMILLAPAVVIFGVVSAKTGFSHHSRYMLPCVPFVFVWISSLATHIQFSLSTALAICRHPRIWQQLSGGRLLASILGLLATVLLCWSITDSLMTFPHSLSHFNGLVGGPKGGPEHLLNSNVDWGQDLLFLEQWIEAQPLQDSEPVYLAFYDYYNPFDLDIERMEPWPMKRVASGEIGIPEGAYAISVNLLYEFPWPVRDRDGQRYTIDPRPLAHLRKSTPIGRAGFSIRIFSAEQVRAAYAAPATPLRWTGFGEP